MRVRRLKFPQPGQQPQGRHADGRGHRDRRAPFGGAQLFGQVAQLAQPHVGHAEQLRAFRRERHAAKTPHQQRHAQMRLQRPDLVADGGRGHGQFVGGRLEAAQARGRFECAKRRERKKSALHA
ncbi:hypothetical protein G6F68_016105 [Rhizopus microsporus]|nr:hypothetical protein G6F68_016105 [Rhizopus microsporus]